jgi:hypothetical protein
VRLKIEPPRGFTVSPAIHRHGDQVRTFFEVTDHHAPLLAGAATGENDGGLGVADYSFLFGNPGDKPVVGDWDDDGIDEIGLHRETTGLFYYRNTLTTGVADGQLFFGNPGDRFVAGDWGIVDGADTPAVFRPSNSTFYFRYTLTQGNADSHFIWPTAEPDWIPVSGDFALD